jgi:hypothetical protein
MYVSDLRFGTSQSGKPGSSIYRHRTLDHSKTLETGGTSIVVIKVPPRLQKSGLLQTVRNLGPYKPGPTREEKRKPGNRQG